MTPLRGRDTVCLKFTFQNMDALIQAPALPHLRPPTCSMLDDSTLNVSLLGGFLVLVVFFVGWNNDRGVRTSPSYIRHNLNNHPRLQLNAIPTIGFSIPILTYLSAVRFTFDGVRMLDEGYKKVICLLLFAPSYQADDTPAFRQTQVYSKFPIFADGWFWLPEV